MNCSDQLNDVLPPKHSTVRNSPSEIAPTLQRHSSNVKMLDLTSLLSPDQTRKHYCENIMFHINVSLFAHLGKHCCIYILHTWDTNAERACFVIDLLE